MSLASTSLAAYHSVDLTELEQRVLDAVVASGIDGIISDEVRACFPMLSYSSVTARFASLEEKGKIYRAGDTRPGESGRQQKIMRDAKFASVVPVVAPTKKRNPYVKGMMAAAKLLLTAADLNEAKLALAKELRKASRR